MDDAFTSLFGLCPWLVVPSLHVAALFFPLIIIKATSRRKRRSWQSQPVLHSALREITHNEYGASDLRIKL
jgi:hypothetical protein